VAWEGFGECWGEGSFVTGEAFLREEGKHVETVRAVGWGQ